jgi:16S rRNA processing protein RimM
VIVKFEGFDRIEDAINLKGSGLWIDRKDAVKLAKDEYFIVDLIGMKVIDEDGNELGNIKNVIPTGANDVYVIQTGTAKEILLPAIKDCILEIDMESRIMRVHLPEGLIDI